MAHVLQLLQHVADIIVHLLHAGFVDAPVLAALFAEHGFIFWRQHGRDMHARRVVPDEEWLVGLLGVIAVEEVDDLSRNFLVHRPRAVERQWAFVLARLVLLRTVEEWHHKTLRGGVRQVVRLGSTAPGTSGTPGIGVFLHGGATVCSVGDLLI